MLASAQFVMVLETSVMNVAISQIVADLDTTIQTAITLYTLVMAAFLLLGAKLGDILGCSRTSRSTRRLRGRVAGGAARVARDGCERA